MNTTIIEAAKTTVLARGKAVMEAFQSRSTTLNQEQRLQISTWLEKTWQDFTVPRLKQNPDQKYYRLLLQVQHLQLEDKQVDGLIICAAMINADGTFGDMRLFMAETNEGGEVTKIHEIRGLTFEKLTLQKEKAEAAV